MSLYFYLSFRLKLQIKIQIKLNFGLLVCFFFPHKQNTKEVVIFPKATTQNWNYLMPDYNRMIQKFLK